LTNFYKKTPFQRENTEGVFLLWKIVFLQKNKEMDNTNEDFIAQLLTDLESDRIERTVSTNNTDKFSQAICVFSNDYPNHQKSGFLLVGVEDNGELSGLNVTDKLLLDLASIRINGNVLPQPAMSVTKYSFDKGDIAVVEVQPSVLPPVRYKGKVWIRTGPSKSVANETEEKQLIEKRASFARTFDALPQKLKN
jgi:ATP-dependent DNA helicase RecG